jgi:hypothetical protein
MSYFYSNLTQENTKNTKKEKRKKEKRMKNAIVLNKSQKRPKKPNLKKSGYSGRLTVLLTANR